MSHTPKQIADLARAALAAPPMVESKIGLIVNPVRWQFMEACTPATILALVERMEHMDYCADCGAGFCKENPDPMTTPLTETPNAPRAGEGE